MQLLYKQINIVVRIGSLKYERECPTDRPVGCENVKWIKCLKKDSKASISYDRDET
jgi:hypothetical protein